MRYIGESRNSVYWPKILGTYEKEIAPFLLQNLEPPGGTIVDVGAAEGYYANGVLFRDKTARVIAFESDAEARSLCAEMAQLNGQAERLDIRGHCTRHDLVRLLGDVRVKLVIMDVEGAEDDLLGGEAVAALSGTSLIVEAHEGNDPGLAKALSTRFAPTHRVVEVQSSKRSWRDIENPWLRTFVRLSGTARSYLLWERPRKGVWLVMTPRSNRSD
jgi:hypothetical protein